MEETEEAGSRLRASASARARPKRVKEKGMRARTRRRAWALGRLWGVLARGSAWPAEGVKSGWLVREAGVRGARGRLTVFFFRE